MKDLEKKYLEINEGRSDLEKEYLKSYNRSEGIFIIVMFIVAIGMIILGLNLNA